MYRIEKALGLPDWQNQTDKIHLLHPLFPRILFGSVDEDGRLEEVLEYLWRVLLEKHGPSEAARLTEYIFDISQHKGHLEVYWSCPLAIMRLLRPAVKYAWGVLDVAVWGCDTSIRHYWFDGEYADYYSEDDIAYFFANFNCQAPFNPLPPPPIAA